LHVAQPMPLPLTVSCFSKIQIGFTFLVPAYPGSPGQRAVKRVCVCVCSSLYALYISRYIQMPQIVVGCVENYIEIVNMLQTSVIRHLRFAIRHP